MTIYTPKTSDLDAMQIPSGTTTINFAYFQGDMDTDEVIEYLTNIPQSVTTLDFTFCKFLKSKNAADLARIFTSIPRSVETLILANNSLLGRQRNWINNTPAEIAQAFQGIQENIKILDLSNNSLWDNDFDAVGPSLSWLSTSVKRIMFSSNGIDLSNIQEFLPSMTEHAGSLVFTSSMIDYFQNIVKRINRSQPMRNMLARTKIRLPNELIHSLFGFLGDAGNMPDELTSLKGSFPNQTGEINAFLESETFSKVEEEYYKALEMSYEIANKDSIAIKTLLTYYRQSNKSTKDFSSMRHNNTGPDNKSNQFKL